jgi:crotonobetainyl-CoA:carnitine CoA-transferase CaiB-like acyl-CoA transferase
MGSQHPNIAPYGEIFCTKDNKQLILAVGTEQQFQELCNIIGLEGLWEDARFCNNTLRLSNRGALAALLSAAILRFSADEILQQCHEKQVPVAPIRNLQELFELPAAQRLVLEERQDGQMQSKRVKTAVFKINA